MEAARDVFVRFWSPKINAYLQWAGKGQTRIRTPELGAVAITDLAQAGLAELLPLVKWQ